MGHQTKTIPPVNVTAAAMATTETVYNAAGQQTKTCEYPAGSACGATGARHTDLTYDALGRTVTQKTWDNPSGTDTLKFTKSLVSNQDGSQASVAEGSDTSPTSTTPRAGRARSSAAARY
jgi:hypothetical protein